MGRGVTSSFIQAAGAPSGGISACPKTLVELVKTKDFTPAANASSSRFKVPVIFVSIKSCLLWVATCGLCNVAVWRTTSMPFIHSLTCVLFVIEPTLFVNAEGMRSVPITSRFLCSKVRTSASPRWPLLPVIKNFII